MRKPVNFIVIVAALVAAAIAGTLLYQSWHDSPRYALQEMVLAIKARDMDKVFNYLDLKEIFNNFLESSTEGLKSDDKGGDEWSQFSRQMGRKFARKLLPKLFDNFEKQIRQAIEAYLQNLHNTQIMALTAAVTTAGIEVQGGEAQVTIKDPKTKKPLRFRMRRSPGTGAWRVVSVNYYDFKELLKKEFLGISPQKDNV